jgi:hypothetical protein
MISQGGGRQADAAVRPPVFRARPAPPAADRGRTAARRTRPARITSSGTPGAVRHLDRLPASQPRRQPDRSGTPSVGGISRATH